jgi:hypothetical protein
VRLAHRREHRRDRGRLAHAALAVVGAKPVEAAAGIVLEALFRKQQDEAVPFGKLRPAGTLVVAGCILGAAVQDDDERRWRP